MARSQQVHSAIAVANAMGRTELKEMWVNESNQ